MTTLTPSPHSPGPRTRWARTHGRLHPQATVYPRPHPALVMGAAALAGLLTVPATGSSRWMLAGIAAGAVAAVVVFYLAVAVWRVISVARCGISHRHLTIGDQPVAVFDHASTLDVATPIPRHSNRFERTL